MLNKRLTYNSDWNAKDSKKTGNPRFTGVKATLTLPCKCTTYGMVLFHMTVSFRIQNVQTVSRKFYVLLTLLILAIQNFRNTWNLQCNV